MDAGMRLICRKCETEPKGSVQAAAAQGWLTGSDVLCPGCILDLEAALGTLKTMFEVWTQLPESAKRQLPG
jgi:hypothetical protein